MVNQASEDEAMYYSQSLDGEDDPLIQTQTTILEGGMGSQVSGHPNLGFATLGSFDLEMSRQGS